MLKINNIKLHKFLGMWLNHIEQFEINDINRYTLILGRNGCGKSRLMKILSLTAPSKEDFLEGGSKESEIESDNGTYKLLIKRTAKGLQCSIYNLTLGTTICEDANPTVYNGYVVELFNYDAKIHMLLTGNARFTQMRIPERKMWFSMLSSSDLGYAIKFYNKTKSHLRDIKGGIKLVKMEIDELSPRVIESKEDLERTEKEMENLRGFIAERDEDLAKLNFDPNATMDGIGRIGLQLKQINDYVFRTDVCVPEWYTKTSLESIVSSIGKHQALYDNAVRELGIASDELNRNNKIKSIDVKSLIARQCDLSDQIVEYRNSISVFNDFLDMDERTIDNAIFASAGIVSRIPEAFQHVAAVCVDGRPIVEESFIDRLNGELMLRNKIIAENTRAADLAHHNISRIDGTHEVDCPKCKARFKPGVEANDREANLETIKACNEKIEKAQEEHAEISEYIEKVRLSKFSYETIFRVRAENENNQAIAALFDKLLADDYLTNKNKLANSLITQWKNDLEITRNYISATKSFEKLTVDIDAIKLKQSEVDNDLIAHCRELENVININKQLLDRGLEAKRQHEEITDRQNKLLAARDKTHNLLVERDALSLQLLENTTYSVIKEERDAYNDILTIAQSRYENMSKDKEKLVGLKKRLAELQCQSEHVSLIVDSISPESGILARYIYNGITSITMIMSEYINSIWGYVMEILPCDISDGELDYKFPFYANDPKNITADVSLGSLGQCEVIDFVFMLTVYKALNLDGYPLFLDELGRTFDELHKPKMLQLVRSLIDSGANSQLFMVSHDPGIHFQLSQADVCVIDPANISLPNVYNTNVVIK